MITMSNASAMLTQDSRIYIAGHRGLVGSAIVRNLEARGIRNLLTRTHSELDLTSQNGRSKSRRHTRKQYLPG